MKKVLSVILSLVLVLSVFTIAPSMANAGKTGLAETGADSGATGDCTWTLDDNGVLTISGNGEMEDYYFSQESPWGTEIKKVVIENGVTSIGDYAFAYCKGLTSVTIPDSVTSIDNFAFSRCTGLTSITSPNSVTSIGGGAFSGCTGLTSVTIGNSVTSIGEGAFSGCTGLTSVMIPDSVTSIGREAFYGCTGLKIVTIGNSVESIGGGAFSGCTGLTSVTIPDSVTSIGRSAFNHTGWYNNQPDGLVYAGKVAYEMKGSCPAEVIIKEGTLGIAGHAFDSCKGLTSVTIPYSVTSIGDSAFEGCTGLTSVTVPDSVTSIGWKAFGYYYDSNQCDYVKVNDFTIYGNKGTEAERYADENGFTFVPLGEMPTDPSTETPTDAPTKAICGDADGDGEVTVLDATRVQRWIADLCDINGEAYTGAALTANELKAADADSDGEVTILDATAIQRHIADLPTNEGIGKTVE